MKRFFCDECGADVTTVRNFGQELLEVKSQQEITHSRKKYYKLIFVYDGDICITCLIHLIVRGLREGFYEYAQWKGVDQSNEIAKEISNSFWDNLSVDISCERALVIDEERYLYGVAFITKNSTELKINSKKTFPINRDGPITCIIIKTNEDVNNLEHFEPFYSL